MQNKALELREQALRELFSILSGNAVFLRYLERFIEADNQLLESISGEIGNIEREKEERYDAALRTVQACIWDSNPRLKLTKEERTIQAENEIEFLREVVFPIDAMPAKFPKVSMKVKGEKK